MEESLTETTPQDWERFSQLYDAYERNLRTGQYQKARDSLRGAMMACPSSSVLSLLEYQYKVFKEVKEFNLWAKLAQWFGSPRQLSSNIKPITR